jgi:hypothetical protein
LKLILATYNNLLWVLGKKIAKGKTGIDNEMEKALAIESKILNDRFKVGIKAISDRVQATSDYQVIEWWDKMD